MNLPLLREAPHEMLKSIRGVCFDIDDTFSTAGKISSEAFEALWQLKEEGFALVPVTGRPAGWCDHIARFWPVDAVVGENGAFVFYMENGVRKRLNTPEALDPSAVTQQIEKLKQVVLSRFPQASWASDQSYREYDLAIDICEDVAPWSEQDTEALLELCKKEGATAKLSSVHVNAWFGEYTKESGLRHWMSNGSPGLQLPRPMPKPLWKEWIYIGDSPNDEPLFQAFQESVGVANLKPFLTRLKYPPRWLTEEESGAGFVELAEALLSV